MSSIPRTMKAWTAPRKGEPRAVLELKTDMPVPPAPKGANIMVKVSCCALNPMDLVIMGMPAFFRGSGTPGADFAGEVVQVGPSVSDIRVGMTVCGTIPVMHMLRGYGVLTEYIVLPAQSVAKKPSGLSDAEAAALMGVSGQTTSVLMETGNFAEGNQVLVNGASGGVGSILTQVLRAKGVHVTAICSGRNEAFVRRLGAEQVVDYTAHDSTYDHLENAFKDRPFDLIVDCVGDEMLFNRCPGYLVPKGRFLSIKDGNVLALKAKLPTVLGGSPRTFVKVMNSPGGARAKEAASWYNSKWVKEVPIDSTLSMDDVVEAYQKLASKRASGKIIIEVSASGMEAHS